MDGKKKRLYQVITLAVIALLSFTLVAGIVTSKRVMDPTTAYLDEKRTTVMELSAAALAASGAVTLIPGDVGTPIANKLADLTMYSLIVLCALFLEKYLVAVTGVIAFRIVIPLSCVIGIIYLCWIRQEKLKSLAIRLAVFGLVFAMLTPISVMISKAIDQSYGTTINEAITNAQENAEDLQENSDNGNLIDRFIQQIKGGISTLTARFEKTLNNLLEAFAILLVTSCIIPIIVLIFMFWCFKMIFQLDININLPAPPRRKSKTN